MAFRSVGRGAIARHERSKSRRPGALKDKARRLSFIALGLFFTVVLVGFYLSISGTGVAGRAWP